MDPGLPNPPVWESFPEGERCQEKRIGTPSNFIAISDLLLIDLLLIAILRWKWLFGAAEDHKQVITC